MSKQTAVKRSRTISAWLKKENKQEQEKEEPIDESSSKVLKKTLRVYLEPLDKNVLNSIKGIDDSVENNSVKEKNHQAIKCKNVENKNQYLALRRSSRNLPSDQKPIEKPVEKDPIIEDLPTVIFKGRIFYTSDFYQCANVCDQLLTQVENNQDKIIPIGFDLEWPFSFQTGSGKTALAQICLTEKICYLFHIYKIEKLPTSFIALLSHPKVKLVGVNIKNDIWKLTRDFKEFPGQKVVDNNCLDCGPYANAVFNRSGRWSLERLTAFLLKKRINKDPQVRKSKWHILPLSNAQKLYAATDAYISLLLHLTIEREEAVAEAEAAFTTAELIE